MQEQVCDPNKRGSHRHPDLAWVPAMAQRWFPATNISTPCCPVLFLRVSPCWHLEQSWTTACSCTGSNTVLLQKAVPVHRNTTWTPDEEFDFIRAAQAHLIQTAMSLLPAFLHYFFFPESFCSTLHQGGKKKRFLSSRVNSHTLQWDECNVLNNKSWKGELFSAPFRWKWSLASILPPTWSHGMIL